MATKEAEIILESVSKVAAAAEVVKVEVAKIKQSAEVLVEQIAAETSVAKGKLEAAQPALDEAEAALNVSKVLEAIQRRFTYTRVFSHFFRQSKQLILRQ